MNTSPKISYFVLSSFPKKKPCSPEASQLKFSLYMGEGEGGGRRGSEVAETFQSSHSVHFHAYYLTTVLSYHII